MALSEIKYGRGKNPASHGPTNGFKVGHGRFMSDEQYREIGRKTSIRQKGIKPKCNGLKKGHKGYRTPESYRNMGGWKWSKEARERFSLSLKGEKGNNWKGGLTPIKQRMRLSLQWREWRKAVFSRDGWTCMECGEKNGNGKTIVLHPHHIRPVSKFPDLIYDVSNGITLCVGCHKKTLWNEENWTEYFESKITKVPLTLQ